MNGDFSYTKYDKLSTTKSETFKMLHETIVSTLKASLPPSREQSLAITKLEESFMWTGKAIRNEQIDRTKEHKHVPERTNL